MAGLEGERERERARRGFDGRARYEEAIGSSRKTISAEIERRRLA